MARSTKTYRMKVGGVVREYTLRGPYKKGTAPSIWEGWVGSSKEDDEFGRALFDGDTKSEIVGKIRKFLTEQYPPHPESTLSKAGKALKKTLARALTSTSEWTSCSKTYAKNGDPELTCSRSAEQCRVYAFTLTIPQAATKSSRSRRASQDTTAQAFCSLIRSRPKVTSSSRTRTLG